MRLFVPTMDESGPGARVSDHFGRAPAYAVVAPATGAVAFHAAGGGAGGNCGGWRALNAGAGDVVACRNIGNGALAGLLGAGVRVLRTADADLAGVLRSFAAGRLEAFDGAGAHDCGCAH